MAELPAPPAPVGRMEIAEEPAAGAVPVGAEMEPPPVVEDEVFFSPIVFGVLSFSFSRFTSLLFYVWPLPSRGFITYARYFLPLLAFPCLAKFFISSHCFCPHPVLSPLCRLELLPFWRLYIFLR